MPSDIANKITSPIFDAWSWWWFGNNQKDTPFIAILTFSILIFSLVWYTWILKKPAGANSPTLFPLPPGPRGLPLVGHLFFIEPDLHRYYAKLAHKYGPIFKLKLGTKLFIVLNSPDAAKEAFKDHDTTFASRDPTASGMAITYGGKDMVWPPYGPDWRMMRKVCVREMVNKPNLDELYSLRQHEVHQLVQLLYTKINIPVNVGDLMFLTMLNLVTRMLWSKDSSSIGSEFRPVVEEISVLLGKPNVSDFFPGLARFDIQGVERDTRKVSVCMDRILDSIIAQRLKSNSDGKENYKDFLQVLLKLTDQDDSQSSFTINHIKALFVDIFSGATDSTATTIEWAMTELMKNPQIMRKAQQELEEVVGKNNIVEESHLSKLSYLDAVIKETFRLHPILPLLITRLLSQSCNVGGYTLPKDARVVLNVWAIHTDPKVWDSPTQFKPERFLEDNSKHDYNGNDFQFLPFGSGRRVCVGIPLVERTLPYLMASLLHSFDWDFPEGVSDVDFTDKLGITLKKVTPLMLIPKPRLSI